MRSASAWAVVSTSRSWEEKPTEASPVMVLRRESLASRSALTAWGFTPTRSMIGTVRPPS